MKFKFLILVLTGAVALILILLPLFRENSKEGNHVAQPAQRAALPQPRGVESNEALKELHSMLVDDFLSTNSEASVTSSIARQLICERLNTNRAFLVWATNAAKSVILRFITNGNVPVYGATSLTADALEFNKVTAFVLFGLQADARFDPNPSTEGPLDFVVEGGIHPTIQRIENGYRMESYQINPQSWKWAPRKIGRMDWSSAAAPLDKNQVDRLARNAFQEMTGLGLDTFDVETKIETPGILNPDAVHPDVTVTGIPNARLYSIPKDYLFPFATFKYGDSGSVRVPFSGEMVQTSPGRGEFVSLFAITSKRGAMFELGEEFLGHGTWEQKFLAEVRAMNTEERERVYRRIFNFSH